MFDNKYIYSLIGQLLTLILIFNIQACEGSCKSSKDHTASISMNMAVFVNDIPQALPLQGDQKDLVVLIGEEEKNLQVTFQKDNSEKIALVSNFKLRISFLEQKSLTGPTSGSKIQFIEAGGGEELKTFPKAESDPNSNVILEKVLLTEFTNYTKLDQEDEVSSFNTDFKLLPAEDAISVILMFELLDANDKDLQKIEVKWIKSEIIVDIPTQFEGDRTTFTIQNLVADMSDLNNIKVRLKNEEKGIKFLLGETNTSEATLQELLGINKLAKDEESNHIGIKVDNTNQLTSEFNIQLIDISAGEDNPPLLVNQLVEWFTTSLEPEEAKRAKEAAQKREEEERKINELEEDEKKREQEIKEAKGKFEAKKEELEKTEKEALEKLEKEEQDALEGKSEQEQKAIKEEYKGKIKAVKEQHKKDLAVAKAEFVDIKNTDKAQEKEDQKQKKELNRQLKDHQESEKARAKELQEKKKEGRAGEDPKIEIMLKERNETDKKFTIELSNVEGELKQEDAQNIKIWYEIKEHVGGDITTVHLKHTGKSTIAPGVTNKANLATLFKDEKKFASVVKELTERKMEPIHFVIEGLDKKAEHMRIVIHLEGAPGNPDPITVYWKSKQEEKKENQHKKEENNKGKNKKGNKKQEADTKGGN